MGLPLIDSKEVIMTWVIPIQPTDLNRLWGKKISVTSLDSSQPHLGETINEFQKKLVQVLPHELPCSEKIAI